MWKLLLFESHFLWIYLNDGKNWLPLEVVEVLWVFLRLNDISRWYWSWKNLRLFPVILIGFWNFSNLNVSETKTWKIEFDLKFLSWSGWRPKKWVEELENNCLAITPNNFVNLLKESEQLESTLIPRQRWALFSHVMTISYRLDHICFIMALQYFDNCGQNTLDPQRAKIQRSQSEGGKEYRENTTRPHLPRQKRGGPLCVLSLRWDGITSEINITLQKKAFSCKQACWLSLVLSEFPPSSL